VDRAQERRVGDEQRTGRVLSAETGQRILEPLEVVVGQEGGVHDDVGEIGVPHQPRELARLRKRVDRDEHRADAPDRERCHREVDAVRHQDAHARAFADALREQALGQRRGASVDLGERQLLTVDHEPGRVTELLAGMTQELRDRGREVGEGHG
jgi:hypothetical protein